MKSQYHIEYNVYRYKVLNTYIDTIIEKSR